MGTKLVSAVTLLLLPGVTSAQVLVSEIMYDLEGSDTDREWIEIYNTSSEAIDISTWKLFEGNTNHGLSVTQGSESLAAGGYAIIVDSPAKFLADWPSYEGTVLDSSFSLNNAGETLILRCCGKELSDIDSVSYASDGGANGDGSSLHRSGSTLSPGKPSPGTGVVVSAPPPAPKAEPKPKEVEMKKEEPKQEAKVEKVEQVKTEAKTQVVVQAVSEPEVEEVFVPEPPKPKKTSATSKKVAQVVKDEPEEVIEEEEAIVQEKTKAESQVAVASASNDWTWWAGAAGISLFGAGGAYLMGRRSKREWDIEDISEAE